MLTKKELNEANRIIDLVADIDNILRGFESPHVETTIGLVSINSASKHKVSESEYAGNFHNTHQDIEKALKQMCTVLLKAERVKLKAKLAKFIKQEQD